MKKIFFLPKYTEKGPSSRYRFYQYIPFFEKNNFEVIINPLLTDEYFDCINNKMAFSKYKLLILYFKRISFILKLKKNDVLFIQHELLPYFSSFFEWYITKLIRVKYVVDFDDAIFHTYDKNKNLLVRLLFSNKIPNVIKRASFVISGSPYLTQFSEKYNKNVIEIPTSIDLIKYQINEKIKDENEDVFIIGWIGSKTTSVNLLEIIPSLLKFSSRFNMKLKLIGFDDNLVYKLEDINYELITWSSETEVKVMKSFDVGIMPLIDIPFINGKCGFKLIQYMACGLPTISTPFEANTKINRNNKNLHATTMEEWYIVLKNIYDDLNTFKLIGNENLYIVNEFYSIQINNKKYIEIFDSINKIVK